MAKIQIAIYSGTIPSTTFIERLIKGLSQQEGFEVLLFGRVRGKVRYGGANIRIIGNRTGIAGVIETVLLIFRLIIFYPARFKKLKRHLGYGPFRSFPGFRKWKKFSPVVFHLPHIFHVQWAKASGDWVFLKEYFGVKLVLSFRGTHITSSPLSNIELAASYRRTFPKYDAFHAVSNSIFMESVKLGAPKKKIHLIYSGLEATSYQFDPRELRSDSVLRILAVGRFHWIKGYQYLLDALQLLTKKNFRWQFTLIAEGKMPEEILFRLSKLDRRESVKWVNGLPHYEVMRLMTECDLLVLPSEQEGIANVVLEAMGIGLPVISTNCGGMEEVIENEINGLLVPVRDSESLANSIIKFSELSVEEVERIRTNARGTILQRFNSESTIKDFVTLYNQVLG